MIERFSYFIDIHRAGTSMNEVLLTVNHIKLCFIGKDFIAAF